MLDLSAAIQSAEELDKAVGIIAQLVAKVRSKPDVAAQKLGQALGEVGKTLLAVDGSAIQFLSLGMDDGALAKGSKVLLDIDSGLLGAEVQRGKGHCHLIRHIHDTCLDKWFESVFNRDDYGLISEEFRRLDMADGMLFRDLERVADMLRDEAGSVLDLVLNGDEAGARARVLAALPVLRPLRRTMANTMKSLYAVQADFVNTAEVA